MKDNPNYLVEVLLEVEDGEFNVEFSTLKKKEKEGNKDYYVGREAPKVETLKFKEVWSTNIASLRWMGFCTSCITSHVAHLKKWNVSLLPSWIHSLSMVGNRLPRRTSRYKM